MNKTSDNALRPQAVPYYGQIFNYNRSQNSENDIAQTLNNIGSPVAPTDPCISGNGDLYPLINLVSQTDYMIRIVRPKFGQIVQCYLSLALRNGPLVSASFNLSAGYGFNTDTITALVPPASYITSCMQLLNAPSGAPFTMAASQAIALYNLNILPLIPQVGDANYVEDFYSIGLHFVNAPLMALPFHLYKFMISGSILVK